MGSNKSLSSSHIAIANGRGSIVAQTNRSRVEQALGRAHHALYLAYVSAAEMPTDDLAEDVWMFLREVERLQSALLKPGNRRPAIAGVRAYL